MERHHSPRVDLGATLVSARTLVHLRVGSPKEGGFEVSARVTPEVADQVTRAALEVLRDVAKPGPPSPSPERAGPVGVDGAREAWTRFAAAAHPTDGGAPRDVVVFLRFDEPALARLAAHLNLEQVDAFLQMAAEATGVLVAEGEPSWARVVA